MRILIYGINYAPELTGIGKYTSEMACWFKQNKYQVDVITAMPYYPEWIIHKQYKRKLWHKEILNDVNIYRCPLFVPKKINSKKRIFHEFSFLISSSFYWLKLFFKPRYDLIICVSPPFHLAIFPFLYSLFRKTINITHIQDLQIDAAKDLQLLQNNILLDLMYKAEKILLSKNTYISTISKGMKDRIIKKGISKNKILMLPNWVNTNDIKILNKEESLRIQFNIPINDIVILYSGNIGKKQGLEHLIEVAYTYKDRSNIHFLIVGSGAELENIKQLAESKKLINIQFYPLQPYNLLGPLLATADLHIILQKRGASDVVMPSKLTGILASGGCPIVSAEEGSSLYSIINDNKIGFICQPESTESLRLAIDNALKSDINNIKIRARKYAENYLNQENIMNDFIKKINLR